VEKNESLREQDALKFGEVVRDRRLELGLKQLDVARAIGVNSGEFIGMVEKVIRMIELNRVTRLAAVLQMNRRDLTKLALKEIAPFAYDSLFSKAPDMPAKSKATEATKVAAAVELYDKIVTLSKSERATVENMIEFAFRASRTRQRV
jgi:transcriptional regulator with XRE-family HTH domain